jgi:hypothetical protein
MAEEKKVHFVCAGECGGVSDHPKNCEAKACSFSGEPLHECRCEDGMHRQDLPTGAAPVLLA